jgi:hypothetical protein
MILGFHCHFPLALSDAEFETLYKHKLRPLLRTINKYPGIPVTIHFSGSLFYRIERWKHDDFFSLIGQLANRKQVELLGGGFYEPMLSLALQPDRIGQVELLTTYIRKHFDKLVTGCYLPSEIWDIDIVSALAYAGMTYTFLPENLFANTQVQSAFGLYWPYITEDKGKTLAVFPVPGRFDNQFLLLDAKNELTRLAEGAPPARPGGELPVLSVFPDLEADTGDGKNTEKIFTALFETLEKMNGLFEFTHASKILKEERKMSKIYIQTNNIKHYFTEYPESANLYSKAIWTKRIIEQIRGDKAKKIAANEQLWKSQGYRLFCRTNFDEPDAIANPLMRSCAYQNILLAEKLAAGNLFNDSTILSEDDFNFDGEAEYIFHGCKINSYIKKTGAYIFELDYIPKPWNYLSTYAARENGGKRAARGAFMDRLCSSEDAFFGVCRDCSKEHYRRTKYARKRAQLAFELPPAHPSVPFAAIKTEKEYNAGSHWLKVRWTLTNTGTECERFYFISEINLAFSGCDEKKLRVFSYENFELPADESFTGSESKEKSEGKKPVEKNKVFIPQIKALKFEDKYNETVIWLFSTSPYNARFSPVTSKVITNRTKRELEFYQSTCIQVSNYIELKAGAQASFEYAVYIF